MWCSQQTGIPVTEEEKKKLVAIFPKLQAAWDRDGPILLKMTESLIKKPFHDKEMIGTVFLCKKTPSMSSPLLINGNWFVKAPPMPIDLVTDILFHEIIHTYLDDNFHNIQTTPLLTKYRNEEPNVLSHLHLMAIQKKVYLQLGFKERIENVIRFDSDSYRGSYKRAWEIVTLEGADQLLAELHRHGSRLSRQSIGPIEHLQTENNKRDLSFF